MKSIRTIIAIAAALVFSGFELAASDAVDCTGILKDRKWTKYTLGTASKGNLQGAAFLPAALNGIDGKDRIYVFKQFTGSTPKSNSYDYYEPATDTWYKGEELFTYASDIHMGSATFGPSVVSTYVGSDGQTYHCTIPFVYVSGHTLIDESGERVTTGGTKYIVSAALDLENQRIVKLFTFPNRYDDCIIGYDFAGRRIWVVGYTLTSSVGVSPYVIDEYRNVDMTDFLSGNPTMWNYTTIQPQTVTLAPGGGTTSSYTVPSDGSPYCLRLQGGGPDADGIQRTLECGTVQDLFYLDNHLYIVTGRGSLYNRTEYVKIHCYYVAENAHDYDKTIVLPLHSESQGLVYDSTNDNIWVTVNNSSSKINEKGLYKYAPRNGDQTYDSLNYQEAQEVSSGTYSITNGSELAWFLMQVYAGRSTINAVLANDIDMTGIELPTTYYINDKTNKFESRYPFRGTFDGNNKTISNLTISKTPFNNDGLFPWISGATVKDFTVTGNITLTEADTNNSGVAVANVGLIGTAEGVCTITGINLSRFTISNPNDLAVDTDPSTINPLVGNNQSEGGSTISGNVLPVDHSNGHVYDSNGFCIASGACDAPYQEPVFADGAYQIANAGNLFWVAAYINDTSLGSGNGRGATNIKLLKDIDLEEREFPGFGNYANTDASYAYSGTFDGNSKAITGIVRTVSSGNYGGFFNVTSGATVKDLRLEGSMTVSSTGYVHGSVVGYGYGDNTITDVSSGVSITVTNSTAKVIGGFAGRVSGTMNRCRYNGVLNAGPAYDRIGGLISEPTGVSVKNSLFDGEIILNASTAGAVGGLVAKHNTGSNQFVNCLSNGKLTIPSAFPTSNCGIVCGASANLTFTNILYTTTGAKKGGDAYTQSGSSSSNVKLVTISDSYSWEDVCDQLDGLDGTGNWEIKSGAEYPVPSKHVLTPHEHNYSQNNGYCTNRGCDTRRQPVEKNSDGYYEIANAGQFYSFVDVVNGGEYSANAILLADIDIDPAKITVMVETFHGMGENAAGKYYTGTFDGQGHTIRGCYQTITATKAGVGFFNGVKDATIRRFTLEGELAFSGAQNKSCFIGTIAGGRVNNSTIEDVTSSVNIVTDNTCDGTQNSGLRILGGIAGWTESGTVVNRCRYNGIMTLDASTAAIGDRFAGIVGVTSTSTTVKNCLFDGEIVNNKNNTAGGLGGIIGKGASGCTVTNCLSVGRISLATETAKSYCGMICGSTNAITVAQSCFYTVDNFTIGGAAASGYNTAGTLKADTWWNILSSLNTENNVQTSNWHMEFYPIPGAGEPGFVVLNDMSDTMPSLEGATGICYTRAGSYMHGYVSVCLPFDLSADMLPDKNCKFMIYNSTSNDNGYVTVNLEEVFGVPAGVPCFVKLSDAAEGKDWNIQVDLTDAVVSNPVSPDAAEGMFGAFNTVLTGAGYYKLNADGTELLRTLNTSHCYPYRAYIKAPAAAATASVSEVR